MFGPSRVGSNWSFVHSRIQEDRQAIEIDVMTMAELLACGCFPRYDIERTRRLFVKPAVRAVLTINFESLYVAKREVRYSMYF